VVFKSFCYDICKFYFVVMKKLFPRFIVAFILFALNVVPVFAAPTQFSILPFTSKSQEECMKVINDFEQQPKIPNDSYIQKVSQNQNDAQAAFDAKNAFDDAGKEAKASQDAYKSAKDAFEKANPGQSCGVSYGGSCNSSFDALQKSQQKYDEAKKAKDAADKAFESSSAGVSDNTLDLASLEGVRDSILGCAIKSGRISLAMIPYFVTYLVNFLLGMAGSISVLFVVLGGYRYVLGGLTEDKEKGKQTIMYALMGFGLSILAWAIVNIVIGAVTG
jgi:hypothetical protein